MCGYHSFPEFDTAPTARIVTCGRSSHSCFFGASVTTYNTMPSLLVLLLMKMLMCQLVDQKPAKHEFWPTLYHLGSATFGLASLLRKRLAHFFLGGPSSSSRPRAFMHQGPYFWCTKRRQASQNGAPGSSQYYQRDVIIMPWGGGKYIYL